MSLLQVRNISISCLFSWTDTFPKNPKGTVISFSVELFFTFSFYKQLIRKFLDAFSYEK